MVFSLTPNPALDLHGTIERLQFNEKLYVHNAAKTPGGNAINVSRILERLGIPTITSGFIGGCVGQELSLLLSQENIKNKFIAIKESSRINIIASKQRDHQQIRLSFPGPTISQTEKDKMFRFFESQTRIDHLVVGGSLPRGFSSNDVFRLIKQSNKRNIKTIIDCPGDHLAQMIKGQPYLIKPNLEEFQALTQSSVNTIGAVIKKARSFLSDVPYICVSSVEGGALLITRQQVLFGRIPKIKIASSTGAGDSMVGALTAQLYIRNSAAPDAELLRWGLAAAAAALAQPGVKLGSAEEILRLHAKTKVEMIQQWNL